jgi:hypothetical protein
MRDERFDWQAWIDVRSGLIGGSVMAIAVWFINVSHGYFGATTAAAKQFAYTFLMGSLVMRLCTHLALRGRSSLLGLVGAVVAPSMLTVGATYLVHSMRGTPEPVLSTIPVAIVSPIAFVVWTYRVYRDGVTPWDRLTGKEVSPVD